jgi:hypothetical protein
LASSGGKSKRRWPQQKQSSSSTEAAASSKDKSPPPPRGQEREFKRLQRQTEELVGGFKYSRRFEAGQPLPVEQSTDVVDSRNVNNNSRRGSNSASDSLTRNRQSGAGNKVSLYRDRQGHQLMIMPF